jgi:RNA polymerase sigma factor (sigma-70 family)
MKSTIKQARFGDSRSREAVVRHLQPRVESCSRYYSRRCSVDADDLKQEMWLGIFQALERVDVSIGDPVQYLLAHGRFALLTSLRRRRVPNADVEAAEQLPAMESVEQYVVEDQTIRGFVRALDDTANRIVSYLMEGHTRSDAARMLGCTPANITYHLRRVSRQLSAHQE